MAATGALVSGTAPIVSVFIDKPVPVASAAQPVAQTSNSPANGSTLQSAKPVPVVSKPAIIG